MLEQLQEIVDLFGGNRYEAYSEGVPINAEALTELPMTMVLSDSNRVFCVFKIDGNSCIIADQSNDIMCLWTKTIGATLKLIKIIECRVPFGSGPNVMSLFAPMIMSFIMSEAKI